jgi:hypothetical protein
MREDATFGTKWNPSINIAQCFEYVVPKMRELGYDFMLISLGDSYSAKFVDYGAHVDKNPATAICEAARAALELE